MKTSNLFIFLLAIIIVTVGAWILFSKKNNPTINKPISICQQLGGELKIDGCFIGKRLIMNEELPVIAERIATCQKLGGRFLGGENMACQIKDDLYPDFSWERLPVLKALCSELSGKWLGGADFQCEIEGVVYSNDWDKIFAWRDSCLESNGEWLGNESLTCQIAGQTYQDFNWLRIDEMKTSCEEYDGQWQGGNNFACSLNGQVYENQLWERTAVAPQIGERCQEAGGTWLAEYQECEGLEIDWCIAAESAFAEIRGLRFDQCLSACRHLSDPSLCQEPCVSVCSLNMF